MHMGGMTGMCVDCGATADYCPSASYVCYVLDADKPKNKVKIR